MRNYWKLLGFLRGHTRLFSIAVVAMMASSLFEGVQWSLMVPLTDRIFNKKPIVVPNHLPPFLTSLVDRLNAIEPAVLLQTLPWVVLGLMILKNIFIYAHQFLMNDLSQRVIRDVRSRLYSKIQNLSLDYFSARRTGELISRITNDVQLVENAISYGVTDLFRQTFLIIFYIAIAFSIHFKAAMIIFILFPLVGWPMAIIGKKLRKLSKSIQERMADINTILLETIAGVKVVKAFCTENYEIGRFRGKNHDYYKLKIKTARRLLMLNPIIEIFGVLCGIAIITWLGKQVMNEKLSFGIFIFFFSSIMSIISPVKKLGNVNALTQQALAANERIYEILERQPTVNEKPLAVELPPIKDKIFLKDVSFRYEPNEPDVLKGINLEIKMGQIVAIVGPTGTGKSTLVNLIPRFYDAKEGSVTVDGIDVREVTFKSLRSQIGIVAQETFLFNDTVKANISYGTMETSQAQIVDAARKAYADQFIVKMPQGYDTVIGDRGFRLSGGEKQRVAIARAILRNPPIMILDEATSQLDSESEKFVQEAMDKLMVGRTVIAIAHRLSTIRKADQIVVLNKGVIVGKGKHEELLKDCELYRRLYETQFHDA